MRSTERFLTSPSDSHWVSLVSPACSIPTSSSESSGMWSPTSYPRSLILRRTFTTLAKVSRPLAPPMSALFAGYW